MRTQLAGSLAVSCSRPYLHPSFSTRRLSTSQQGQALSYFQTSPFPTVVDGVHLPMATHHRRFQMDDQQAGITGRQNSKKCQLLLRVCSCFNHAPVPPPIPAVTNTKSVPAAMSAICWRLSSAALRPMSGTPPAPRPRVMVLPIVIVRAPYTRPRACMRECRRQQSLRRRVRFGRVRLTAAVFGNFMVESYTSE